MKKNRNKAKFLECLKKVPIVQVACEQSNLSRNTIYRWKHEDPEFETQMQLSMTEGEEFISDLSETQLLNLIKEKSFPALRFSLSSRSPKYRNRIELTTKNQTQELTPEQMEVIERVLNSSKLFTDKKEENND